MCKVSVIVPVYKIPEDLLRKCFDSLTNQTLSDSEFIIVSDGAPQQECNICKEYIQKDSRFHFFENEHTGVSATRNFALQKVRGDYLLFLDADDYIDFNLCKKISEAATNWNSDIIIYEITFDNINKQMNPSIWDSDIAHLTFEQKKHVVESTIFTKSSHSSILCGVCCKAYKTTFVQENNIQFQKNLRYAEDQLFNTQALVKTDNISYLSKTPFYHCIYRNNSSSHSYKANYDKEVFIYLDSLHEIFKSNSSLLCKQLFHNRVIECILYTLYICIFSPEKNVKIHNRKEIFQTFISNTYCKEALHLCEKNKFSISERILIHLCRIKSFWGLFLISKKWYL